MQGSLVVGRIPTGRDQLWYLAACLGQPTNHSLPLSMYILPIHSHYCTYTSPSSLVSVCDRLAIGNGRCIVRLRWLGKMKFRGP